MGLVKFSSLCLTLCVLSCQQSLAQDKVNDLIDGIWENLNLTDNGSGIPSIGDLLGPSQNELITRTEEVLSDFVAEDRMQYNISEDCFKDIEALLAAATRREYWALRMIDAMGKPPSGLQDFRLYWVGNWDECLSVQANAFQNPFQQTGKARQFGGKYCTASMSIKTVQGTSTIFGSLAALKIGVCIPDTCSSTDSTTVINTLLKILPVNLTSSIQPATVVCPEKETEFSTKAIISIAVCGFFVVIIAIATAYDVIIQTDHSKNEFVDIANGKANGANAGSAPDVSSDGNDKPTLAKVPRPCHSPGTAGKLLLSFSLYTNIPKILSAKQPSGTLTAVNGVRFLSMTWVVLGHTYSFEATMTDNLATHLPTLLKRISFQAIGNATVSVDTFFMLSGLLVSYLSLKEMKKCGGPKNFRWGLFYFHRYWRLTPPYMLILMVYVTTFKYWSDGPFWPQDGVEINECKDSWWMNMLYINNLFGMDKQCLGWSWYLDNDMQFYLISPIMLIPLFYSPILGGIMCFALILTNFVSAGIISYNDKMPANLLLATDESFAADYYFKPWCRIGPYVVGFILGYILFKTECKPKLTKLTNAVGWLLATTFALLILYGLYSSDGTEQLSRATAAVYNATHRTVWGACVAWVIYACATGYGGPVNTLLSWKGIIPLSRLTYCCYLVHPPIMCLYYYRQRSLQTSFDLGDTYMFLGHLCITYGVAFIISLAFESPMMGLEKVLFGKKKKS